MSEHVFMVHVAVSILGHTQCDPLQTLDSSNSPDGGAPMFNNTHKHSEWGSL